jgi:hypothetical protein
VICATEPEAAVCDPCEVSAYTPPLPAELWLLVIIPLEKTIDLFGLSHASAVRPKGEDDVTTISVGYHQRGM